MLASLAASYQTQKHGGDEDGRSPKRNFSYIPREHRIACHAHFNITLGTTHQLSRRAGPSREIGRRWREDPPG